MTSLCALVGATDVSLIEEAETLLIPPPPLLTPGIFDIHKKVWSLAAGTCTHNHTSDDSCVTWIKDMLGHSWLNR